MLMFLVISVVSFTFFLFFPFEILWWFSSEVHVVASNMDMVNQSA